MLLSVACNNTKKNPYENSAGINPAQLAQADVVHYTEVLWKDSVQNFGTIKPGDSVSIQFTFKNIGKNPLFITGVKPNCGCTVADYPRKLIEPGEENTLTAVFKTQGQIGTVHKSVRVSSNTSNGIYHTLQFYGIIKQ